MEVKLCQDCKWLERKWFMFKHLRGCMHPNATDRDPVTGFKFANIERMNGGDCGPNAKNWIAK